MRLEAARGLASRMMFEHGLTDEEGWQFAFDNAKRRCGCCYKNQKRITLSKYFVLKNAEDLVQQTMLHEIAHAISPQRGHGRVWRHIARQLGHSGSRCNTMAEMPEASLRAECDNCGVAYKRFRVPRKSWCGSCPGQNDGNKLTWKRAS